MDGSDQEIIRRIREGDADRYRLLVDRYARTVFRLAFRMTGNGSDAEDIVQETFLRAYRNLDQFRDEASFGSWIYRIAANCALDLIRVRRREGVAVEPDESHHLAAAPAQENDLHGTEIQMHLRSAMDLLSATERTAFVLRHFEGMSIDEISNALGTRTSATKHTIFRAVRKMRSALEPMIGARP
ncbi:MAG: sigma-70 family RNA polymerase sigma factor [Thermoanaerobaculia bacterium]